MNETCLLSVFFYRVQSHDLTIMLVKLLHLSYAVFTQANEENEGRITYIRKIKLH